jgi:GH24 family phage-related lysozyme (muramidase)/murein DD-endopeptidase MepM/ murein hydrolase activator NlpD
MENNRSKIKLKLVDILDQPIKNLMVEIKTADKVWHKGLTNAAGMLEFSALRGKDLIVHVEHWIYKDMKPVAKFFTGLEEMAIKLVSPKVKHTVPTKPKGTAGNYLRGTYKVKAGDNLSKIAKAYNVSDDYLAHLNHIADKNTISVGQVIKVPPVTKRSTSPQPHTPARELPPHSAPSPEAAPITARGTESEPDQATNAEGQPVTILPMAQPAVIFPLRVRPLNEAKNKIFTNKNWTKGVHTNAACFGSKRTIKIKDVVVGHRKHAGRDLYAEDFTEVVAIARGKVLYVGNFYLLTHSISIHHTTSDGREFVARYGEIDPATIEVVAGDTVEQGQIIGKTGILRNIKTKVPEIIANGKNVSMLHFELFTGEKGLEEAGNLTMKGVGEFERRTDLVDSITILQEGYINTFRAGAPSLDVIVGERIPIAQLHLSQLGELFIKDYEKHRLDYYEDSEGYCTVGWGHLTGGKTSCASQGISVGITITEAEVQALFDDDKRNKESLVKSSIRVPLYQHEYDALCSLAFNIGMLFKKAPSLCRKINAGDYAGGAVELLDITNHGLAGLVIRRKQENAMFLTANYDSSH